MKVYLYATTAVTAALGNPGWGEVGFGQRTYSSTDYSYGCYAVHHLTTEKIHLQTGKTRLLGIPWLDTPEAFTGWSSGDVSASTLPCKIYVERGDPLP
jgi:hypothetical protein